MGYHIIKKVLFHVSEHILNSTISDLIYKDGVCRCTAIDYKSGQKYEVIGSSVNDKVVIRMNPMEVKA